VSRYFWCVLVSVVVVPSIAGADPATLPDSLVRVRVDNRFGVAKQHDLVPFFGMATSDAQTDTEVGTAATASCGASYQIQFAGIPPGVYFVRVAASNPCGPGSSSNEVTIPIP
jgi:hypothetical protein